MRDTFVVKQDFERFAAKLVCCWTYYLDVMDGGDSSWATISFTLFSVLYFFARFVLATLFDSTLRAEE